MKDLISMIPRKGKTSNSVSLVFLLLLLSGDVEPSPDDPRDILRTKSATLTDAISNNLDKVAVRLNAERLIPQQAVEDTSIAAHGNYKKASNLVGVLQTQLRSSSDHRQYLIDVCNVLKDKDLGDETLATLANDMLKELGITQQEQMNGHRTSNGGSPVYPSSTLTIIDLSQVLDSLKDGEFPDDSWRKLGLKLGLSDRTLSNIKSDNSESEDRLRECISKWLKRVDHVDKYGGANWKTLCDAVEKIDPGVATSIRRQYHILSSQPNEPTNPQHHFEPDPPIPGELALSKYEKESSCTETRTPNEGSDEGAQLRQKPSHTTTVPSNTESSGIDETDNLTVSNPDKWFILGIICFVGLVLLGVVISGLLGYLALKPQLSRQKSEDNGGKKKEEPQTMDGATVGNKKSDGPQGSDEGKKLKQRLSPRSTTSVKTKKSNNPNPSSGKNVFQLLDVIVKWCGKKSVLAVIVLLVVIFLVILVVDALYLKGYMKELLLAIISAIPAILTALK